MNPVARLPYRNRNQKIFSMFILTLGIAISSFGQIVGDYQSRQSGSWNIASSWRIFTNEGWTDATNFPDKDDGLITILNTHTINVPDDFILDVDQLVIDGALLIDKKGVINIMDGDGLDLTINDGKTLQLYAAGQNKSSINVSGQIKFIGESYVFDGGNFSLLSGATIEIGSANGIVLVNTATTGHLRNSGTKSLSPAANYVYNGTVAQVTGTAYPDGLTGSLTIDNTSGVTLNSTRHINAGTLNLVNGVFTVPGGINGLLYLESAASLYRSGGSISGTLSAGIYNVTYIGTSKETGAELSGNGLNDVNIDLEAGETLTLNQNRFPDGNLTINSGIFDLASYTFNRTLAGGALSVAEGAVLRLGGNTGGQTGSNFPSNFNTVTLDNGSIIEYDLEGDQTIYAGVTYSNLTLSGSGEKSILSNIVISNNLAIKGTGSTLAILADGTSSTAQTLTLNDIYQSAGTWGGTGSDADNKNDTYFGTTTTGILTVTTSCTPGTWYGAFSSDWFNGDNWCGGVPAAATDVVIPYPSTNYPVISGATTAYCNSLSINSGASLTIEPGGQATILGSLTVESGADLTIQSTLAGEGMLMFNSGTQTGEVNVELYLLGGENRYHYFVPSVEEMNIGTDVQSASTNLGLDSFNGDLVLYDGDEALNSMEEGWQYFDGYGTTNGFSSLYSSRGYNIWLPSNGTLKFKGSLNSSTHSFAINYVSNTLDYSGWNLVGNPYPVNYDLTGITALSSEEEDGIANTIYYTNNGIFESFNPSTGIGSVGTSPIIRPMQGFFVFATQAGTLSLPSGSKTFSSAQQRFKGEGTTPDSKESAFKLTRLSLNIGSESDETLVLLVEGSTNEFNEIYDGFKLFSSNSSKPFIYSKLNGTDYFMKAVACPEANPVIVPLEVVIKESGEHSIKVAELENMEGYNIILRHGNVEVPLTNNSTYTLNLAPGTYSDFELEFEKIATGVESVELSDLKTWYNNNYIYINFPSNIQSEKGKLTIFDYYGKQVYRDDNLQVVPEQTIQIPVNFQKGVYFIDLNVDFRHFRSKTVAY